MALPRTLLIGLCLGAWLTAISPAAHAQWGDRALIYCGAGLACYHGFDGITDAFLIAGAAEVDVLTERISPTADLSSYRIIVVYYPNEAIFWEAPLLASFHADGGVLVGAAESIPGTLAVNDIAYYAGLTTRLFWDEFGVPDTYTVDPTAHLLLDGVTSIVSTAPALVGPNGGTTLVADGGDPLVVVEERMIFTGAARMWSDALTYGADQNPRFWENIWRFYAPSTLENGDFESGGDDEWTIVDLEIPTGNTFHVWTGSDTPNTGFASGHTPGPGGGSFFALADPGSASTSALVQSFTLPPDTTSAQLDFDLFVFDHSTGAVIDPAGLTHLGGSENHHARVDILTDDAGPFDTQAAASPGVLENLYLGADAADGGGPPYDPDTGYQSYSVELLPDLVPGGTYQLRFGFTTTSPIVHVGVDDVALTVVPEPDSRLMLIAGVVMLLALGRRSTPRPTESATRA